jgi:MFS superfamily sulfate permease-like transporter
MRRHARGDLLAGSTLAAYAVPSSIAYAQLAGMPVQTGLYCYLYGGSRTRCSARRASSPSVRRRRFALTLAVTLGALAGRDPAPLHGARDRHRVASWRVFALFAAAMRWGGIVHFISETVLTGFKIGAGIVIAASQLPLLLGLAGSHGDLWRTLATCRSPATACTCRRSSSD